MGQQHTLRQDRRMEIRGKETDAARDIARGDATESAVCISNLLFTSSLHVGLPCEHSQTTVSRAMQSLTAGKEEGRREERGGRRRVERRGRREGRPSSSRLVRK